MATFDCAPGSGIRAAVTPKWTVALFALTPLIVGFLPPTLVFSLNPNAATDLGMNSVAIPAWLFIGVWLIVYPSMGVAAWQLWKRRGEADVCVPIGVLIAGFLITLTFWLTNSLRMTATLDLINLILAWTATWVFSRYAREASVWLLPWAIWMPITLAFKVAALTQS